MGLFRKFLNFLTIAIMVLTVVTDIDKYLNNKQGVQLLSTLLGLVSVSFLSILKYLFFLDEEKQTTERLKYVAIVCYLKMTSLFGFRCTYLYARGYGLHAMNIFIMVLLAEFMINESPNEYRFTTV